MKIVIAQGETLSRLYGAPRGVVLPKGEDAPDEHQSRVTNHDSLFLICGR
jgi:hypothetical protein